MFINSLRDKLWKWLCCTCLSGTRKSWGIHHLCTLGRKVKVAQLCPTLCDYTAHGILQARILEWVAFPFSRGIFPTQESNPGLLHCRRILYQLNHKGSPRILEWVTYPFSSRSARPRNWTRVSCIAEGFFTNWAIREAQKWRFNPFSSEVIFGVLRQDNSTFSLCKSETENSTHPESSGYRFTDARGKIIGFAFFPVAKVWKGFYNDALQKMCAQWSHFPAVHRVTAHRKHRENTVCHFRRGMRPTTTATTSSH